MKADMYVRTNDRRAESHQVDVVVRGLYGTIGTIGCVVPEPNFTVRSEPSGDGSPPMCVIFEEDDECLSFEPMTGAIALTDIKGCKAASLTAITDQAVDLKGAAGEDVTVGGTSAKALEGVAAVGEAAASDLTMASAEECLATCALWIPDCTHVTVGMLQFHTLERSLLMIARFMYCLHCSGGSTHPWGMITILLKQSVYHIVSVTS